MNLHDLAYRHNELVASVYRLSIAKIVEVIDGKKSLLICLWVVDIVGLTARSLVCGLMSLEGTDYEVFLSSLEKYRYHL
jgi:hypothetical protein